MKRQTTVFTDLGGVCATSEDRATTLRKLIKERGGDTSVVNNIFPSVGGTETYRQYMSLELGTLDLKKVWRRVLSEIGINPQDWPFEEFQIAHLATISLIEPVVELYARISKEHSVPFGVVSDGDVYSWFVVGLMKHQFHLNLNPVIVSSKYNVLKPALFEEVVKSRRREKMEGDIIYIENRYDLALEAQKLGWCCVLFDGLKQSAADLEKTLQSLLIPKKKLPASIIVVGS